MKTAEFPELATVLLYAFGEYDVKEDGGGVEAHPRLTTGTLYRAVDNVTTMKAARDIILSLAPSSFKISLSSCYNYTENYRKGSRQAIQHHHGICSHIPKEAPTYWCRTVGCKPPLDNCKCKFVRRQLSGSTTLYGNFQGCQGSNSYRHFTCTASWSYLEKTP